MLVKLSILGSLGTTEKLVEATHVAIEPMRLEVVVNGEDIVFNGRFNSEQISMASSINPEDDFVRRDYVLLSINGCPPYVCDTFYTLNGDLNFRVFSLKKFRDIVQSWLHDLAAV